MSVEIYGPLRVVVGKRDACPYPYAVNGEGWDEPDTCHNDDEARRAIAADVQIITEDDAHAWYGCAVGPTCDAEGYDLPKYEQTLEAWRAWLMEVIGDAITDGARVRLEVFDTDDQRGRPSWEYSWWTERAEVAP